MRERPQTRSASLWLLQWRGGGGVRCYAAPPHMCAGTLRRCECDVRCTVGQIHQKCKETSNLTILWVKSYLAFLLCGCPGEKGRILIKLKKIYLGSKSIFLSTKCSSLFTWRFLYILVCSGPRCGGASAARGALRNTIANIKREKHQGQRHEAPQRMAAHIKKPTWQYVQKL